MSVPQSQEEFYAFQQELDRLGIEGIEKNLRLNVYGNERMWKRKEAEARVKKSKDDAENRDKQKNIELQAEGNDIARQANAIAKRAYWISLLALLVSVLVSLFK